jgi:hypothetical protein|tara:strand:+ start:1622 stop:1828 length:207 start_codon:yes stop_codon:yes gene_type:complete
MTTTINPYDGMTLNGFLILLEQNGISLDESRMHEVNYYFNLWCDTMRHDNKVGAAHDFDAYIAWMKKL